MKNPQGEYSTKNLFIASFIIASGKVKFVGLKTLDYKTKLFYFLPLKEAERLEVEYFSGGSPGKDAFCRLGT